MECADDVVNFEDATLQFPSGDEQDWTQLAKGPHHACYLHIPICLGDAIADDDLFRMRTFLTTTFAGNADGRFLDMAMEALSFRSCILPQKILILRGPGGDGKSARSHLRSNILGDGHMYMSTSVFELDDEFRKQGGQFAHARCVTFQECPGHFHLKEDIFKTFVVERRLLVALITVYPRTTMIGASAGSFGR